MFAPGVPEVMKDFHTTNLELSSFVVSVYLLGYAFGPLIIAPLSEMYGRLPIYHLCNILFIIFTVACAVATDLNSLIVFRFFEGVAGSSPLTIGAGTLSDIIVQERRGAAMAAWALGPLLGPVVGPIAGGYLTQAAGWRWTFWVIAIAVSFSQIL
jgi:multidrug resistance protein